MVTKRDAAYFSAADIATERQAVTATKQLILKVE